MIQGHGRKVEGAPVARLFVSTGCRFQVALVWFLEQFQNVKKKRFAGVLADRNKLEFDGEERARGCERRPFEVQ